MSREILFKAKRVDNGEWVEGYIARLPTGKWEIARKCDNPPDCDPMWNKVLITYEVDPETLCQYTGLTDKNGERIWENDVLSCKKRGVDFERCKVVWDNHYADWRVELLNFGLLVPIVYDMEEPKIYARNYKKVGNIFDNPKLLKQEG